MKKLAAALIMCLSVSIFPAYAQTDSYGNVIDWETDGYSDTDGAGEEIIESSVTDEPETYSFAEQTDVLKMAEEYETEAPSEKGYLTIVLSEESTEWNRNNIRVVLYRGSAKEEIFLYRQAGWEAKTELPVGKYTVYKAETIDGSSQFIPDFHSFFIKEDSPVTIYLSPDNASSAIPEVTIPDIVLEETDKDQEMTVNDYRMLLLGITVGVMIVLGTSGIIYVFRKSSGHHEDNSDLLD